MEESNKIIINSRCFCNKGLIWIKSDFITLIGCDHILHKKCYDEFVEKKVKNNNTNCPICNSKIKSVKTFEQIKKLSTSSNIEVNKSYYQRYIDTISISNFDNYSKVNKDVMATNIIDFMGLLSSVPFIKGREKAKKMCDELLCLLNAKVVVNGMQNINNNKPHVLIANHTTYLDFLVIFYLFQCGFLSSSYIKETWYGRLILDMVPLMIIERGKDFNTVEGMKKYVEKYGSICLFPEGMITHPDTLIQFRTGAFNIGYPINPVVIRYEPVIYDNDMNIFVQKLLSSKDITIYVDVLPEQTPPFSDKKIERIRTLMAKTGNFALSRVSNKDIKDNSVKKK